MSKLYYYTVLLTFLLTQSCQKENTNTTPEETITGKFWYLDKKTVGQQSYSYNGSSTFSFLLTRSTKAYRDSDGIEGTYTIAEQLPTTELNIESSRRLIDAYQVSLLEKDQLILTYTKNNLLYTFYFSTRR
ncbi:MAG: hypothetical protein FJ340_06510 [Sphingomonadales bacterium]|nr:hypothetical protein [Sphingomonadales bacterium]